jgi:hypothetical protein
MSVSEGGTQWDAQSMFEEAAKFHLGVEKSGTPLLAVLKPYTTLKSFIELANYKKLLGSYDWPLRKFDDLGKDLKSFDAMKKTIAKMIKDLSAGAIIIRKAEIDGAYEPNEKGLKTALGVIETSEKVIGENANLLRKEPVIKDGSDIKLDSYESADTVERKLPVKKEDNTNEVPCIGSALAACAFSEGDRKLAHIFWQNAPGQIMSGVWAPGSWAVDAAKVGSVAGTTPLAPLCASDGKNVLIPQKTSPVGPFIQVPAH